MNISQASCKWVSIRLNHGIPVIITKFSIPISLWEIHFTSSIMSDFGYTHGGGEALVPDTNFSLSCAGSSLPVMTLVCISKRVGSVYVSGWHAHQTFISLTYFNISSIKWMNKPCLGKAQCVEKIKLLLSLISISLIKNCLKILLSL